MSTKKIKVDQLAETVMDIMKEFEEATDEAVDKGVSETAQFAVKELHNAHPTGSGRYGDWSKYNKGWKYTQTKKDKKYHKKATVHNATDYQLTHLLEHGHAKVNGGRTRAFPHIAPVAEKCETKLVEYIKNNI